MSEMSRNIIFSLRNVFVILSLMHLESFDQSRQNCTPDQLYIKSTLHSPPGHQRGGEASGEAGGEAEVTDSLPAGHSVYTPPHCTTPRLFSGVQRQGQTGQFFLLWFYALIAKHDLMFSMDSELLLTLEIGLMGVLLSGE